MTQVVVARQRRADGRRQAAALGVRRRRHRAWCERRVAGHGQPEARDRRGRGAGARDPAAERGEDAAVPDRRRRRRSPKTCGCEYRYLDLRRPRLQRNIGLRHRVDDGDPAVLRRAGLLGDRDADPDEVDAGRRARLPGAEPRPPGRVLRAAAVAADLQADPDDRRHRSLLPDRALLPRRGPARRPPARVHAGRRRDVVRAPRT